MARRPRRSLDAPFHHVYTRGVDKGRIVLAGSDWASLAERWCAAAEESGVTVLGSCILGNHLHGVPEGPIDRVSMMMQKTLGPHAQRINARDDRSGHLFQGRFHSVPIYDDLHLQMEVGYVVGNAAVHGIISVAELASYPWSAFGALMGGGECRVPVDVERTLSFFGRDAEEARANLLWFVREAVARRSEDPVEDVVRILVDRACEERGVTWERLGRKKLPRDLRIVRAEVLNLVRQRLGVSDSLIARALGTSRSNLSRTPRIDETPDDCLKGQLSIPLSAQHHEVREAGQDDEADQGLEDGQAIGEGDSEDPVAEGNVEDVGDEGAAA